MIDERVCAPGLTSPRVVVDFDRVEAVEDAFGFAFEAFACVEECEDGVRSVLRPGISSNHRRAMSRLWQSENFGVDPVSQLWRQAQEPAIVLGVDGGVREERHLEVLLIVVKRLETEKVLYDNVPIELVQKDS